MKAFRNLNGEIREIDVDISLDGTPILPVDTTIAPRPVAEEGHYVTVVGRDWVQIPVPVLFQTFETKQNEKVAAIAKYRDWYTEQGVEVGGVKYDADDQARSRLTQALVMFTEIQYLPPAWVTEDNSLVPISTIDDLKTIVIGIQNAFATRFFECSAMRVAAESATTQEELDAVVIPAYGNNGFMQLPV